MLSRISERCQISIQMVKYLKKWCDIILFINDTHILLDLDGKDKKASWSKSAKETK